MPMHTGGLHLTFTDNSADFGDFEDGYGYENSTSAHGGAFIGGGGGGEEEEVFDALFAGEGACEGARREIGKEEEHGGHEEEEEVEEGEKKEEEEGEKAIL